MTCSANVWRSLCYGGACARRANFPRAAGVSRPSPRARRARVELWHVVSSGLHFNVVVCSRRVAVCIGPGAMRCVVWLGVVGVRRGSRCWSRYWALRRGGRFGPSGAWSLSPPGVSPRRDGLLWGSVSARSGLLWLRSSVAVPLVGLPCSRCFRGGSAFVMWSGALGVAGFAVNCASPWWVGSVSWV